MAKKGDVYELEDLIELAEKVSKNIQEIENTQRQRLYSSFLTIFVIVFSTYFLFIYSRELSTSTRNDFGYLFDMLSLLIVTSGLIIVVRRISSTFRMNNEIKSESIVLKDLMSMIEIQKKRIDPEISVLKKATIEMRLNRLNFNHNLKYRNPFDINDSDKRKNPIDNSK